MDISARIATKKLRKVWSHLYGGTAENAGMPCSTEIVLSVGQNYMTQNQASLACAWYAGTMIVFSFFV